MDSQTTCQFGDADFRGSLNFLEHPHLRTGQAATFLKFPKILAHGPIDHPELLQDFKCQLGEVSFMEMIGCTNSGLKLYC